MTQKAWIVATGAELALGLRVDTNSAWIAQRLAALGIRCDRHVTVSDDPQQVDAVLSEAVDAVDLVVLTGGLGTTADDLTRPALARLASDDLVEDADSVARIHRYFADRGRIMSTTDRVQALRPRSGRSLANSVGTAPGIFVRIGKTCFYALPGVPSEMKAMFDALVALEIASSGGGPVLLVRSLHCFGLPETQVGSQLDDLMRRGANPEIGTGAAGGIITVRIAGRASAAAAARRLLDEAESQVRERLGEIIFGRDESTLAQAVGALLLEREQTLSTAESCTGGLLGKLLTDVPGSSAYYAGGAVSYADQLKQSVLGVPAETLEQNGAVSPNTASQMACGAQRAFKTDYALAITGIAGPDGGTPDKPVGLVYIGLATPRDCEAREFRFPPGWSRSMIRDLAANTALNMLRLALAAGAP